MFYLLVIVFSVLLQTTGFYYPLGIFKLFLKDTVTGKFNKDTVTGKFNKDTVTGIFSETVKSINAFKDNIFYASSSINGKRSKFIKVNDFIMK